MLVGSMTPVEEIRDIQGEMARIRHDLHADVRGVVKEARAWTDWGRYVRERPWLVLGTAVAIGYWAVPRRRREPPSLAPAVPAPSTAASASDARPLLDAASAPASEREQARKGRGFSVLGAAFGLVSPIVVRAAQNYAVHRINQWMAEWQDADESATSPGPEGPRPSPVPGRPRAGG